MYSQKNRSYPGRLIACALVVAFVALMAPSLALAASAPGKLGQGPQQSAVPTATVIALRTAAYAGPGTGFWVLAGIKRNVTLPVTGVTADHAFWQVNTQFGKAYLLAQDVRVSNAEAVPVVDPGLIGRITGGKVTVRTGPGFEAPQVGVISRGQQFFVIGRQPDSSWIEIRFIRGTGWVNASLTDLVGNPALEAIKPTTAGPTAIISASFLNLRSGPGLEFTTVGTMSKGDVAAIIGRTADGVWLLLQVGNLQGWVNRSFVTTRDYFGNAPIISGAEVGGERPMTAELRSTANLREGPNLAFKSLGQLSTGTPVTILGQSPDRAWWFVESPIGKGWLNKNVVKTQGDFSSAPIVQ